MLVQFIFFLLLTIIGAAGMAHAVDDYRKAADSLSWNAVEGTVLADGVEGGHTLRGASYVYVVNGTMYENSRTRSFNNNRWLSREPALSLRQGQAISVYAHPAMPSYSIVVRGVCAPGFFGLLLACLILLFIGAGGLWFVLLRRSSM